MRYISPYVKQDLSKKMVFIGGPRQCGKTTLAKSLLKETPGIYLNWDSLHDKKMILNSGWADDQKLVVFDEIHKYKNWKNLVKGYFDTENEKHHFLVTGSARLDVYRKGGDSLLGRYHYWRLHPFSLFELPNSISPKKAMQRLLTVGGFPEPFLSGDERQARRWREERNSRILRDDIRDLEGVRQIEQMALLLELLKTRTGSTISLTSLAEDLHVSSVTVGKWIEIFEKMYLIFVVRPYSKSLSRGIKKAFKVYFYDIGDVDGNEGARFENLVASHLLQQIHFWQDYQGLKVQLCYLRDKEKHEVDFAIIFNGKVHELIEAKWSNEAPSPGLFYFAEKLHCDRKIQIVGQSSETRKKGDLLITNPLSYFSKLREDIKTD
jgi:predicted AAA+ superfamily ATPase